MTNWLFGQRSKNTTCTISGRTELIQLIHCKKWGAVIVRCRDFPLEVHEWYVEKYERKQTHDTKNAGQILERLLPLHLACELNAPFEVMQCLLEVYPDGALMKEYGQGSLPLHLTSTSPHNTPHQARTLQLLLSHYPKSINVKNNQGQLPIHLACAGNLCVEVIRVLLFAYEDGLQSKDKKGNLPLHLLCISPTISQETLALLLSLYPQSVHVKNYAGDTAGDIVGRGWCGNKLGVLALLKKDEIYWKLNLQTNGKSADINVETTKKSDLHKLIERKVWTNESNHQTIQSHLKSHPEEAKIYYTLTCSDEIIWMKYLPIHLAIESGADLSTLSALLAAYPNSAKKQNHKGQLPLHLACECATDIDVFLEIYKYNDDVVKAKDENGMLCIHLACWGGAKIEIIKFLIQKYPASANIEDNYKRTPAQIANKRAQTNISNYLQNQSPGGNRSKHQISAGNLTNKVANYERNMIPGSQTHLTKPIQEKLWYDVITSVQKLVQKNEKTSIHIIQFSLQFRPPTRVVELFLKDNDVLTVNDFDSTITLCEKYGNPRETTEALSSAKLELYPHSMSRKTPLFDTFSLNSSRLSNLEENSEEFESRSTSSGTNLAEEWDRSSSSESEDEEDVESSSKQKLVLVPTQSFDTKSHQKIEKVGVVHGYQQDSSAANKGLISIKSSISQDTVYYPYDINSASRSASQLDEVIPKSQSDFTDVVEYGGNVMSSAVDEEKSDFLAKISEISLPSDPPLHQLGGGNLIPEDVHGEPCSSTSTEIRSNTRTMSYEESLSPRGIPASEIDSSSLPFPALEDDEDRQFAATLATLNDNILANSNSVNLSMNLGMSMESHRRRSSSDTNSSSIKQFYKEREKTRRLSASPSESSRIDTSENILDNSLNPNGVVEDIPLPSFQERKPNSDDVGAGASIVRPNVERLDIQIRSIEMELMKREESARAKAAVNSDNSNNGREPSQLAIVTGAAPQSTIASGGTHSDTTNVSAFTSSNNAATNSGKRESNDLKKLVEEDKQTSIGRSIREETLKSFGLFANTQDAYSELLMNHAEANAAISVRNSTSLSTPSVSGSLNNNSVSAAQNDHGCNEGTSVNTGTISKDGDIDNSKETSHDFFEALPDLDEGNQVRQSSYRQEERDGLNSVEKNEEESSCLLSVPITPPSQAQQQRKSEQDSPSSSTPTFTPDNGESYSFIYSTYTYTLVIGTIIGTILGTCLHKIARTHPGTLLITLTVLLLTSLSSSSVAAQEATAILLKLVKRLKERCGPHFGDFVCCVWAMLGRRERYVYPPPIAISISSSVSLDDAATDTAVIHNSNGTCMIQSFISLGLLGGVLFGAAFRSEDALGWAIMGAAALASLTLWDDERGDLARCLGMLVYILVQEGARAVWEMCVWGQRLWSRVGVGVRRLELVR